MKGQTLRLAVLVAFVCLAAGPLFGPAPARAEGAASKPKVGATIFPLYDIARQVAGPVADVILILPSGASPHTFEPTPSAVRSLAGANALLVIGHGLDDWAVRLARGAAVSRLVRVDAGVASGTTVPVEYDPLLAKIAAWAPTRESAIARLRTALGETVALGPHTNLAFLAEVLDHPAFRAGDTHTAFIDAYLPAW